MSIQLKGLVVSTSDGATEAFPNKHMYDFVAFYNHNGIEMTYAINDAKLAPRVSIVIPFHAIAMLKYSHSDVVKRNV